MSTDTYHGPMRAKMTIEVGGGTVMEIEGTIASLQIKQETVQHHSMPHGSIDMSEIPIGSQTVNFDLTPDRPINFSSTQEKEETLNDRMIRRRNE